ncbi:uncharacterized protein LOC134805812 [Cydia splendana]|uniref:uncharacterized protein LOC134805812 n=1 Tax=Cydia splendana TaxID=1100963 RepID=UPI00300DA42B
MAHLNVSDVNKLPIAAEGVTIETKSDNIRCTHCAEGKQTRLPFNKVGSRATQPLELIHSDLCGPMEHLSVSVDLQGEEDLSSVSSSSSSDKEESPVTSDDSSKGNTAAHLSPTNSDGTPGSKGKAIKPVKDNNSEDSNSEYQTDTDDLDETYYPPVNTSLSQSQDKKMTLRPRKNANENTLFCLYTNLSDPQSVE